MAGMITVSVGKDKQYWQARWRVGKKQRSRSLGRQDKMSAAQAKRAARQLEIDINRGRVTAGSSPKLSDLFTRFMKTQKQNAPGTQALFHDTYAYLTAFFDENTRIDKIERADARDWRTELVNGDLVDAMDRKTVVLAENTIRAHTRRAKQIFELAYDDEQIAGNPFAKLPATFKIVDVNWAIIDRATVWQMIEASPNDGWRCLLALARFAGLRQNEAMSLKWDAIDWDKRTIIVHKGLKQATTKKKEREVPMEPELHDYLFELWMKGDRASDRVCDGTSPSNLWRDFGVICQRISLDRHDRWCHTLRKNLASEWYGNAKLSRFDVAKWMGHSPEIAERIYHQVLQQAVREVTKQDEKCSENCSENADKETGKTITD